MANAAIPISSAAPRPQPQVRHQYLELKANVHRKLLNRLNLEALAQSDRARAESEIRTLLGELLSEENTPLSLGERVRILLNRAAEPFPIPPKQIEGALGHPIHHTFPSDYKTVSTALNSGVPLALAGQSDIAAQFDRFTRMILDPSADSTSPQTPKRRVPGLERLASIW